MTNRTKALLCTLLAVGCSMAYAASYNRVPSATFANASTVCGAIAGNQCYITDCATPQCLAGGGTEDALSQYNGSAWVVVASAAAGGSGALSGTSADPFTLDTDGDAFVLSPQAGGRTLTRATAGTVTLLAADNDATAQLNIAPGGIADMFLGGSSTAGVISQVAPGSGFNIRNNATGVTQLAFQDYADSADDDMNHVQFQANCTDATTGAEDCDLSIAVVEAGAAPEQRLLIDADNGITVGSANTNNLTVTTDSTGNAEVVLPDSSVGIDEVGGNMLMQGIFCGDLPNNTTNYTSPVAGYPSGALYSAGLTGNDLDYALAGTGCAAEDSTTEATADEIMFTGTATKVLGLYCRVSSSGSNGVVLRVRSAAASLTPDITCTIATGQTECRSLTPTTTDIAANATVAVSAVSTEDLSTQDYWCMVQFALQ
jgi:hypothetical protein